MVSDICCAVDTRQSLNCGKKNFYNCNLHESVILYFMSTVYYLLIDLKSSQEQGKRLVMNLMKIMVKQWTVQTVEMSQKQ